MTDGELIILDTHVWVWWLDQDDKLPEALRERVGGAKRCGVGGVGLRANPCGRAHAARADSRP
jgi:hypothetical protein